MVDCVITRSRDASAGTHPGLRASGALFALSIAILVQGCGGHDEGSARNRADRTSSSSERVLATALHAAHAKSKTPVSCEGCHELVAGQHLQAKSWRCQNCHTTARLIVHGSMSETSPARECWSCHDFNAKDKQPKACLSCHDKAQGSRPAIAPHDPAKKNGDCGSCHRAHEERPVATVRCESCHDKTLVSGHKKPDIPIAGCASCHGYHESGTKASEKCTSCHRQSRALVSVNATFAGGHEKCSSCHQAHGFEKAEVRGCKDGCHENVVALSEDKVSAHRGCIGCHDKHDVKGREAGRAPQKSCESCHSKLSPQHPKDHATGTRCVGCHKPHAGAGTPVAVACSSCHPNASTDRGLHRGTHNLGPECRNCHEPHRFRLASNDTKLCARCHGSKPFANARPIRTAAEHSNCVACHGASVAHEPAGPRAACTSCHEKQAAAVHAKHKNCLGCHEPHTTEQKKTCGGCHRDEKRTAPAKHQDCQQCHDAHSTTVSKSCTSCHEDRTSGIHRTVKGGCMSCHRPHGPGGHASPPSCTSCHTGALPWAHRVDKHQKCADCHRSHGPQPYRTRAACLTCHKDRKDHEPDATLCIGCHVFGGAK